MTEPKEFLRELGWQFTSEIAQAIDAEIMRDDPNALAEVDAKWAPLFEALCGDITEGAI